MLTFYILSGYNILLKSIIIVHLNDSKQNTNRLIFMLILKPSKYLAQFIDVKFSPIYHRILLVSLINSVCPLNKH